ncbi:uncharacterized protein RSE6_00352 [Rhynchosporium secalis]|uniref:Copper acquisition factor BIM1-like domain-containing protein n=1 Tax=Rhynchosporium secalis TaxID=38038 RepID=A0A1E1LV07_RHYSE|nr:uncharacterized protein RSE6_00352 [Rhynchosporium secalis]
MPSLTNLSAGLVAALLVGQTSAHFLMLNPKTAGFDDDLEGTAPCGSFTVDFSSSPITKFHVDGDAIALQSTHPETKWLFRATIGTPTMGNLTTLSPVIEQNNIGSFCRSDIKVPESFAGRNGTITVTADGPDGLLYQCAAVTFVAGASSSVPHECKNTTGVVATYTDDPELNALPKSYPVPPQTQADTAGPTSASTTSSPTHSAAATKSSAANANGLVAFSYTGLGSLAWVGVVGTATFLACLL